MSKKQQNELDGIVKLFDIQKIDPSPYQHRKYMDEDKLKELALSIQREGLIEPIVVRPNGGRYQLIAGERRWRAIRDHTDLKAIQAKVVVANYLQARRISAAENLLREDLSPIEGIEAIVEIVDVDLIEDKQYRSMGKSPTDRVKTLLGRLHSIICSKRRGSKVSKETELLYSNVTIQVKEIFENLPKPLEWRSFYLNDLPILMDINEEVRKVSNQNHLTRAQIRALKKLKDVSPEEFQRVTGNGRESSKTVIGSNSKKSAQVDLKDLSGREIEGIAEKAAKKESLKEFNRPRVSPSFKQEPAILMMSRLGIRVEGIAARLKINRKTAKII